MYVEPGAYGPESIWHMGIGAHGAFGIRDSWIRDNWARGKWHQGHLAPRAFSTKYNVLGQTARGKVRPAVSTV